MRIRIIEPYGSPAMKRAAAPIVDASRAAGHTAYTAPNGRDQAYAGEYPLDLAYHLPWHTLTERYAERHVALYTHCNPGAEDALREACELADAVVVMSAWGASELEGYGVDTAKVEIIPMGVGPEFKPRNLVLGIVGQEQPNGRKRSHILLDLAWQRALENWTVQFVGDGWDDLAAQLQMLQVEVGWSMPHDDTHMAIMYQAMDCLLVTGYREGGPLPVLEALACGVPVISPLYGYAADAQAAIPESVHLYRTVEDLAELLGRLAAPSRARAAFAAVYTWERWGERHVALFERVADSHAHSAVGTDSYVEAAMRPEYPYA